MSANPSVNRCLADEGFDHIDHALGRPIHPLRQTYRNYFATELGGGRAASFAVSPHWRLASQSGSMAYYKVTKEGRVALVEHLRGLNYHDRAFAVTFEGRTSIVPARSRGAAKYALFLAISDCFSELMFRDFAVRASVRLAP